MTRVPHKTFIDEETLLQDAYRLAVGVYESGFRPDFIVGIWRGGSTVAPTDPQGPLAQSLCAHG